MRLPCCYKYVYVYVSGFVCTRVSIYVCMCVCICACVYIFMLIRVCAVFVFVHAYIAYGHRVKSIQSYIKFAWHSSSRYVCMCMCVLTCMCLRVEWNWMYWVGQHLVDRNRNDARVVIATSRPEINFKFQLEIRIMLK